MTEPSAPVSGESPGLLTLRDRLREHKIAQWTLAYAAAAYTLLHVVEMVGEALEWPRIVPRIVTLVLGLGFPIVVTLAWYQGAKALKRVTGPELTIITILLVIAGTVLWGLTGRGGKQATVPLSTTASGGRSSGGTMSAASRTTVAVMPFVNLTGDPSKEYLGDGMAEEIIDKLTDVQGLKVPARTSSFAYKGRNTDIRQIARDLGVGTVLEGSVRAAGERIRITAQLINAQDGLHMWSQTYDERLTDLFKLQDDMAQSIVRVLTIKLGVALPELKPSSPTQDVEAYRQYLQANEALDGSEQGFSKAISLLDQALSRDPGFARALAARGTIRLRAWALGYGSARSIQDAEHDAGQALSLDPSLATAQALLGDINSARGNWIAAEANFKTAVSQEPGEPQYHVAYSLQLANVGHLREALAQSREALRLAPADKYSAYALAAMASLAGLDTEALASANLAIRLGVPANVQPLPEVFKNAAVRARRFNEAAESAISTLTPPMRAAGGESAVRAFYAALADPAKAPDAISALEHIRSKSPDTGLRRDLISYLYQLGALDPAFSLANETLDLCGKSCSWAFLWAPESSPFRRDPRFAAFAERLGLIDYSKRHGAPDDCSLKDGVLSCQ
jgi:TolB-like protein